MIQHDACRILLRAAAGKGDSALSFASHSSELEYVMTNPCTATSILVAACQERAELPALNLVSALHKVDGTHKASVRGGPLPDLDRLAGLAGSKHPTAGAANSPIDVAESYGSV